MAQISKVMRSQHGNRLMFWCPGCQQAHVIVYGDGASPRWLWNGDMNKPTFSPSILVRGKRFTPEGERQAKEWAAAGYPSQPGRTFDSVDTVCHTFVKEGRIQFLSDCTHELAGQTVDLPDLPEWLRDE